MTMYLWLKLLAFGFAFLDTAVFVAGNFTGPSTQDEQTTTPALTPASNVSSATAPSTTAPTSTSKPSCADKYKGVSVGYTRDENNYTFTATLNVKGEECEPPGCEQQHRDLSACEIKVINISHPSCEPPLEYLLEVPPDPNQFELIDCVKPKEADTSLCLRWQNENFPDNGQFKCDENKIEYKFQCDGRYQNVSKDTFEVRTLKHKN